MTAGARGRERCRNDSVPRAMILYRHRVMSGGGKEWVYCAAKRLGRNPTSTSSRFSVWASIRDAKIRESRVKEQYCTVPVEAP